MERCISRMARRAPHSNGNAFVEPQKMPPSLRADASNQCKGGTAACISPRNTNDLTDTNPSCASCGHTKCGQCTNLKDNASHMEYGEIEFEDLAVRIGDNPVAKM